MAQTNSVMFVELLLWKTSRDCYEVAMGYGTLDRERLGGGLINVNQLGVFDGVVWVWLYGHGCGLV